MTSRQQSIALMSGRASARVRRAWLWVACSCLLFAGIATAQPLLPLADGAPVALSAGQGVLAVAIDTTLPLSEVRLRSDAHARIAWSELDVGRHVAFYVVPAGRWHWQRVRQADGARFDVGRDDEFAFDVRAGVVNYPGDLVFRPRGSSRAVLHVANRALGVLDRLARQLPALTEVPFVYQGHYPDPFPAFYRHQLAERHVPAASSRPAPPAGPLPIAVERLWRAPVVQRAALSPDGRWIALQSGDEQRATVQLLSLATGLWTPLAELDRPVQQLTWAGADSVVIGSGFDPFAQSVELYRIADSGGAPRITRLQVPRLGEVVDPLPLDGSRLLFASTVDGRPTVHRLDIGSQAALDRFRFSWAARLNRGIDGDLLWLTDGHGRLRAAQAADRHGANVLYHGSGGQFAEVLRSRDEDGFEAFQLSLDGALIYGLSEQRRAQRDLVALNPATGDLSTVFQRPGVDVVAPLFGLDHRLIGASYVDDGRLVNTFFGREHAGLAEQLRARFGADRSIRVLDQDAAGDRLLIAVEASDQPEALWLFQPLTGEAIPVASSRPWLDGIAFAPSQVLHTTTADGLVVESYLTLPAGQRPRPLIVLPHGGPIGIRFLRRFDPEVQFLASLGYAVLQVNYRGSEGFGAAFREAGEGKLGTLIESDIDAAVDDALAQFPLDAGRMCILGASYGGYSAIVSTLRRPERYRCAVSIAGFTDRVLQFTASDSGRTADVRALLEQFMGDPATELASMLASSPVYRYRELRTPLLLAHGTEDLRVDYEQTRRLVRLLGLAGQPPVLVTLYGDGHSIDRPDNRERLWQAVAGFLRQHLEQAPAEG